MFEKLEHRKLLSAALKGDVLNVRGTAGDDIIIVRQNEKLVIVQISNARSHFSSSSTFKLNKVHAVKIDALAGNDRIDARQLELASTINGGSGNDTIFGGENSVLVGGSGKNKLKKKKRRVMPLVIEENPDLHVTPGLDLPPAAVSPVM